MIYIIPESLHPFENCQKCLCMMCFKWYIRCRDCYICYPFGGTFPRKFCRYFVPNVESRQVREWYDRDSVLDGKGPFI